MTKPNIYYIRHKETKELFVAKSGKRSWSSVGAAKNAWANTTASISMFEWKKKQLEKLGVPIIITTNERGRKQINYKFDEQDTYEIVSIEEGDDKLFGELTEFLLLVYNNSDHKVLTSEAKRLLDKVKERE